MPILKYTTSDKQTHTVVCSQKSVNEEIKEAFAKYKVTTVTDAETGETYHPCLYCDPTDPTTNNIAQHFQCDNCQAGMCDACYDLGTEHDGIYQRPYESEEWIDERQPEYVCNGCLKHYKYNKS